MKIISIGDIHGRNIWELIVKQEAEADLFVFMGDYFDTRENITAHQQIENFKKILKLDSKISF